LLKQQTEQVPWTTKQTFIGAFWTLVPWLIITGALSFFSTSTTSTTTMVKLSPSQDILNAIVNFVFSVIVEGAFVIAPLIYAWRLTHPPVSETKTARDALGIRGFDGWRALPLILALFIGIVIVNEAYQLLITTFHLHIQTNDQVILSHSRTQPITTYATLLAAALVAPLCEELFFRSFVFMGLLRDLPVGLAVVFSALIFAMANGDPASFPVLFCIGIALAYLRWSTRSYWPGVILHFLNNGLSAVLLILAMHGINM
jgi:membrane protease YdiL (CAAX protease family)